MSTVKRVDAQEIWRLYELGLSKVRIAREVGCHRDTVYYHLDKGKGGSDATHTPELDTHPETVESTIADSHSSTVSARRRERSA